MDKNPLITRLNKVAAGTVLEIRRFGRSNVSSIWVEAESIQKVGEALKNDPECKLDWLENLSVVEFEGVFVVTYFLRSTVTRHSVVIRLSTIPSSENAEVTLPSIQNIWPMGKPMEQDAGELFGIYFKSGTSTDAKRLPEDWQGFPLRKSYVFPKEFMNIPHSRPFNNRSAKKSFQ